MTCCINGPIERVRLYDFVATFTRHSRLSQKALFNFWADSQTSGCLEKMQVLHLANVEREGKVIDEGAKFLRRAANDDAFDDVIVVRALAKMITALREALYNARMENTSLHRDLVIVMLFLASLHHMYLDQVKYKCAKQRQVDACKKVRIVGNRFGTF